MDSGLCKLKDGGNMVCI